MSSCNITALIFIKIDHTNPALIVCFIFDEETEDHLPPAADNYYVILSFWYTIVAVVFHCQLCPHWQFECTKCVFSAFISEIMNKHIDALGVEDGFVPSDETVQLPISFGYLPPVIPVLKWRKLPLQLFIIK